MRPRRALAPSSGSDAVTRQPPPRDRAGRERAAGRRDPLGHAGEAEAARCLGRRRRRRRRCVTSSDQLPPRRRARSTIATRLGAPWRTALLRLSCTSAVEGLLRRVRTGRPPQLGSSSLEARCRAAARARTRPGRATPRSKAELDQRASAAGGRGCRAPAAGCGAIAALDRAHLGPSAVRAAPAADQLAGHARRRRWRRTGAGPISSCRSRAMSARSSSCSVSICSSSARLRLAHARPGARPSR